MHNENLLKTKTKSYEGIINTQCQLKCIYLSVVLNDSVVEIGKNYYPQVLLEEYKCIFKFKKETGGKK